MHELGTRANSIEHIGQVAAITATGLQVSISSQSACAACHAKGACIALESTTRLLDIACPTGGYSVGDAVKVVMPTRMGLKSVLYGYLLPLMVVVIVLFALCAAGLNEGLSGLIALCSLVPYYLGLRLLNKRIASRLSLQVERL